MQAFLARLLDDKRGATAIEYALVAGLISIAILGVLTEIGPLVQDNFTEVQAGFESVQ